jgi:hypothetical protein
MTWLIELLLPAALSAVLVFLLSFVMHMVLPWHKSDYATLPHEDQVLDALRPFAIPPGEYMAPRPNSMADMKAPEFLEKMRRGPVFMLNMFDGMGSMGRSLGFWFVYILVVAGFAGHIAQATITRPADGHLVFHTVALASFMGYSFGLWQMTIWYRRSWIITLKSTIDGLLYAVVTGGVFWWLWAR